MNGNLLRRTQMILTLLCTVGVSGGRDLAAKEPTRAARPANAAGAAARKSAEDAAVDQKYQFGIHDRATPPADYEQRLEKIVARLQKTGAKLIWASTTPIPKDEAKKQTPASIVERNAIAARVMQKHGIAVDDLFTFITPHLATAQNPHDVHFTAKGYGLLGGQVAESILARLKTNSP